MYSELNVQVSFIVGFKLMVMTNDLRTKYFDKRMYASLVVKLLRIHSC